MLLEILVLSIFISVDSNLTEFWFARPLESIPKGAGHVATLVGDS